MSNKYGKTKLDNVGCGNSIVWSKMNIVPVPPEFSEGMESISTQDIKVVPDAGRNQKLRVEDELRKRGKDFNERGVYNSKS